MGCYGLDSLPGGKHNGMRAKPDIYQGRFLSEGYPDLDLLIAEHKAKCTHGTEKDINRVMDCIGRLIDLSAGPRSVAVIGCGPAPHTVRQLLAAGYDAVGVEPVETLAAEAANFLGDSSRVRRAGAETLPFEDCSMLLVFLESVIEHVDSPIKSLEEIYRVLCPGGVLFITTNNRLRLSLTGRNHEFRKPFYNWFPHMLKECYVHHHLNYDPRLANFTPRPAVHWFSFADLCELGREAGFAKFYSLLDLIDPNGPGLNPLKRLVLSRMKRSPVFRALVLSQAGLSMMMLKRSQGQF